MAGDLAVSIKIGAVTGGLFAALGGVKTALTQLGDVTGKLQAKQRALGEDIQKYMGTLAPQTLAALNRDYERLGATIDKLNAKQQKLAALQVRGETLKAGRADLRGQVMETVAIGATAVLPVKLAIDFESAMADVKKVVDFETPEGFTKLGDEILKMTRTLPLAATELAAIAAAGGQLGVKADDIPKFTETVAKMATAFDMPAELAGDAMAKLANVYQIPIANIGRLGDAINQLSNESPAKASDIVSALSRVGGVAKGFGLTELQAASLANAFISLGKPPEVAGTAINGMLMKLATADKQGNKFQAALADMGLSAAGLKKAIAEDAQGALVGFLQTLEKVPADQRMGILVDMFGLEYADDVAVLAGSVKTYTDSVDTLNKKGKDGKEAFSGSMEREFAARAATTANNLRLLKNGLSELGINIGSTVLPALNELVNDIKPVVSQFAGWAKEHPALVSGMVKLVAGIAAFRLTALAGRYAFSLMASGINEATKAMHLLHGKGLLLRGLWQSGAVRARLPWLPSMPTGGFSSIGTSLMTGFQAALPWIGRAGMMLLRLTPIGLVLSTVGLLVYKYWQPIKGFFVGLWQGLSSVAGPAIKALIQSVLSFGSSIGRLMLAIPGVGFAFRLLRAVVAPVFNALLAGVRAVWTWFKNLLKPVDDVGGRAQNMGQKVGVVLGGIVKALTSLPAKFIKLGADMVDGLVNGIKTKLGEAVKAVSELGEAVAGKFKSALGIHSPSRVFMGFGENIAQGAAIGIVRSAGLATKAAAGMASDTAAAAMSQGINAGRPGAGTRGTAAGAGSGGMVIHFSPQITIQGGDPAAMRGQVNQAMQLSFTEFERMMKRYEHEKGRTTYGRNA